MHFRRYLTAWDITLFLIYTVLFPFGSIRKGCWFIGCVLSQSVAMAIRNSTTLILQHSQPGVVGGEQRKGDYEYARLPRRSFRSLDDYCPSLFFTWKFMNMLDHFGRVSSYMYIYRYIHVCVCACMCVYRPIRNILGRFTIIFQQVPVPSPTFPCVMPVAIVFCHRGTLGRPSLSPRDAGCAV